MSRCAPADSPASRRRLIGRARSARRPRIGPAATACATAPHSSQLPFPTSCSEPSPRGASKGARFVSEVTHRIRPRSAKRVAMSSW
jgi:hypothetical protein